MMVPDGSERLELTEREREVLTLGASGLQTADMAEHLFLSSETGSTHVHNAVSKLGGSAVIGVEEREVLGAEPVVEHTGIDP